MAAPRDKGFYKKTIFICFLVCEGLSSDDFGVARGTLFQERYGRKLVSKPAISLKNSRGGNRRTTHGHQLPAHFLHSLIKYFCT